jgi:hypothetical protein
MYGHREQIPLSLQNIFPFDQWPKLAHFGITRFEVTPSDLLEALGQLPRTCQSIELNRLRFFGQGDIDDWLDSENLKRFGMFHGLTGGTTQKAEMAGSRGVRQTMPHHDCG